MAKKTAPKKSTKKASVQQVEDRHVYLGVLVVVAVLLIGLAYMMGVRQTLFSVQNLLY
jgi:hypothetical protein